MTTPEIRAEQQRGLASEQSVQIVEDPMSLELLDDAPSIVRELPVQSFVTVARKLRDENRLDLVLPHASAEQITGIFDLDAWERERLAVGRAREWLDRIIYSYREASVERGALTDLIHATDPEMWVLSTAAMTAIAELDEPDNDEMRQQVLEDMAALRTWETPDGHFIVGVPDNGFGHMALRVLLAVYDDSLVEGRKLVSAIKWSLHAELEEDLLRWRQGRLADLGFPEWEEAMRLFSPLARDLVLYDPEPEPDPDADPDADAPAPKTPDAHVPEQGSSLPPATFGHARDLLRRVMRQLDDEEYDLRLREFLLLANELMAAQRFEPGDEALQERAVAQAQATLNLACELLLAAGPQPDPEGFLADRIRSVGLRRLFRFGYGPLAKLRKAALGLHRSGQVSLASVGSLLDRPWGPALATLSAWYPELPLEGKGKSRPLRNLGDLARATSLIGEAGALASLCFAASGMATDPVWINRIDEPERLRLGDLVRTALICRSLPGEPTGAQLRPLGPRDLAWAAAELIGPDKRLVPGVRAKLDAALARLELGQHAEALAAVLLPRLGVELLGLELDDEGLPDLTRAAGLVTIQHVGVWLTTSL